MATGRVSGIVLALLVGGHLLGCGGGDGGPTQPPPPTVTSVEVTPATQTLTAFGETFQFSAVAKDAGGRTVAGRTFTWTSSDEVVATVDAATGLATAVGNGTATITARTGGVSGSAELSATFVAPQYVEGLIAGSFNTWWYRANHHAYAHGMATSVMADQHTSSWGNFYMREAGSEPRQPIVYDPSHPYAYVLERPFEKNYTAIVAARDGLIAIAGNDGQLFTNDDTQVGTDGEDTPRALAFARFVQGLAHASVGVLYDRGLIVDETTDLEAVDWSPYADMVNAGLGYLQEAIDWASDTTFTIPSDWVGTDADIDNQELVRLAHSYMARFMASVARDVGERAAVDWGSVITHIDAGITADFVLQGDGEDWVDDYKYNGARPGWSRIDLRMLGPADQQGSWPAWEALPPADRMPFDIDTDDARLPAYPPTMVNADWDCYQTTGRTTSCGKLYTEYRDPMRPFQPEYGTYHFSGYADVRYVDYLDDHLGQMVEMNMAEMNLLKAEALIRTGQAASAVPLINITREANGELPPVTVDGASGARCVPRNLDGSCGDLMEAMKYEKRWETFLTWPGLAFYDDRGWGDLITGTSIQWPVPVQELSALVNKIYTAGPAGDNALRGLKILEAGELPSPGDMAARVSKGVLAPAVAAGRGPARRRRAGH